VQKYIDRQGPYTCHECGRKQHDPFNRVEVMSESDFTILGGCDDCNNRIIQDMHDLDQEAMA
jgi:DNA-directed RNA polymerase subunit RPC12/RpoP